MTIKNYSNKKNISPLVSVIVPTYNRESYIGNTIESILNQSYKNIEIIVISDGSSDSTSKIVSSKMDDRIIFIDLSINSGLPAIVRNIGMKEAKGKYIAFCDDDDLWNSEKIEFQVDFLESNKKYMAVCTKCAFLFKDGTQTENLSFLNRIKVFIAASNLIPSKYLLLIMNFVINSSLLMRNKTSSLGFLNESEIYRGSEDFEYWIRLGQAGDIYYLNKSLVKYRIHDNQLISIGDKGKEIFLKIISNYTSNILMKILVSIRKVLFRFNIV